MSSRVYVLYVNMTVVVRSPLGGVLLHQTAVTRPAAVHPSVRRSVRPSACPDGMDCGPREALISSDRVARSVVWSARRPYTWSYGDSWTDLPLIAYSRVQPFPTPVDSLRRPPESCRFIGAHARTCILHLGFLTLLLLLLLNNMVSYSLLTAVNTAYTLRLA